VGGAQFFVLFVTSFENWVWAAPLADFPNPSPLTGKDKGRGDGFDRFPSTPIPPLRLAQGRAFPHQGERGQVRCGDMSPSSSLCGRV
jgi:hypothetical protein